LQCQDLKYAYMLRKPVLWRVFRSCECWAGAQGEGCGRSGTRVPSAGLSPVSSQAGTAPGGCTGRAVGSLGGACGDGGALSI